jgi:hypothetical protein
MKTKPGQILILVLLIVVVALSVGLSVASRNITNLRSSTQTEQSQRAFSAAEGGVEDVLADLSSIASNPDVASEGGLDVSVPVGEITASVNVKSSNIFESAIEEGTVGQINLEGYGGGNVTIEWISRADSFENSSPRPSVELTFVCQNATCFGTPGSNGYSQHRLAFQAESISGQSGFSSCTVNPSTSDFYCRTTVNVSGSDNPLFMRVRPLWKKATVRVSGAGSFPVQTYDVVSTATTDLGITRKVQVRRTTLPQLPAALDYVLFSENDIVK